MTAEVCVLAERSAERAAQSEPMVSNSYTVMPLEVERLLERAHRVQGSRTLECTSTPNTRQYCGTLTWYGPKYSPKPRMLPIIDWPRSGMNTKCGYFGRTTTRALQKPSNSHSLPRHSASWAPMLVISSVSSHSSRKESTRTISTGCSPRSPIEGTSSTSSASFR